MSMLQELLYRLEPRVLIEQVEAVHDQARGSFTLQSPIARDYPEFQNILIVYVTHHMEFVYGYTPPPDFALDRARKYLDSSSIGFDGAAYIGLTGSESGMYRLADEICRGFKEEGKKAYFNYIVDTLIPPLSYDDIISAMEELKDRLSAFAPQSFGYANPGIMAANYRQVIWTYIENISRYRNIWGI